MSSLPRVMTFPEVVDPRCCPAQMKWGVKTVHSEHLPHFSHMLNIFSPRVILTFQICRCRWLVLFYFDGGKCFMCLDLLIFCCMFSPLLYLGKRSKEVPQYY